MMASRNRRWLAALALFGFRLGREHPGILITAALARIDDQAAAPERDTSEAAGDHADLIAVKDVRAKVDAAPFQGAVDQRGVLAELDRALGDVGARILFDSLSELLALLGRGLGAYQHAVAAGGIGLLHHQL